LSPSAAETHRVRLRPLNVSDLDLYRRWLRPDAEWRDLDGPYYPRPEEDELDRTLLSTRLWIESGCRPDPLRRFAVADPSTDLLFGAVARYWISRETHWPAIGIDIYDPKLWGRGLGFEALGLWTDLLFREERGIVRLDLRTWSGNTRMMRLAEKLGYRLEARFRKARVVDGVHFDALGYGILKEEWQARYPEGFSV
jgi:putative hydrolase of HD superfamily